MIQRLNPPSAFDPVERARREAAYDTWLRNIRKRLESLRAELREAQLNEDEDAQDEIEKEIAVVDTEYRRGV